MPGATQHKEWESADAPTCCYYLEISFSFNFSFCKLLWIYVHIHINLIF